MWQAVDGYCERTSAVYWAEPVNALTNLAFVLAAWVMWRRCAGVPLAQAMCLVLAVIGGGSYLFHTHANGLTGALDVAPILGFILLYLFALVRDGLGLAGWRPFGVTAGFVPYAAATVPVFEALGVPGGSAAYAPVPLLILIFAGLLWRRAAATARGLAVGAAILVVSLSFRTLDMPLCGAFPLGTHFLWHLMNALMLGWMIEVYRRHMLAGGGVGR